MAGVWAHSAKDRGIVEPGDVEEAVGAASAVGDDRLQKESPGLRSARFVYLWHFSATQPMDSQRPGHCARAKPLMQAICERALNRPNLC